MYVYLKNSDGNKYGLLKKNLQSQYALQNNQYPKTISTMTDVLTNHQWDDKYDKVRTEMKQKKASSNSHSGSEGSNNDDDNQDGKSLAQKSPDGTDKVIKCFCCGEKGHYCNKCPKYNDIEWNDWYFKPLNDKGVPEKPVKYETEQLSQKVSWSGTQVNKGVNACQIKKAYMLHQAQTEVNQ